MSFANRLLKYGVHGGLTYGALYYLSGADTATTVDLFGTPIPLVVAGLGLGIASSVANDLVHSWILPMISTDQKLNYFEGIATGLGAGAGSMVLFSYLAEPRLLNDPGMAQLALVGAATEIASQWVYERLATVLGVDQGSLLM
jgi:hypothetical protein